MMRSMRNIPIATLLLALLLPSASAGELRILAWNVESGTPRPDDPSEGSDPETIADQLQQLSDYDIVGLSEVRPSAAKQFVDALSAGANGTYLSVSTATGMDDRLLLAWNSKRLQLLESYELHRYGNWLLNSLDDSGNWRHRSPLVGHFRDRESGVEFLGMVNHLARGDESVRNRQAIGLRNWATEQKLPVVAFGDFNFDFDFHTQQGNRAYQRFVEDGQWAWLKPELVDSNWADADPRLPLNKRKDQYPDSILDFVFVSGSAKAWGGKSWVIVRDGDFPDNGETSDHRPVAASFELPAALNKQTRASYPEHWWAPVTAEDVPDWEILPQAASPGEVILSKRHELGLLSNFAATPFTYRGKRYASLEGFWQAMLYPEGPGDPRAKHPGLQWKFTREQVEQMTAFDAKAAGDLAQENMKTMGIDWVTFEGQRFEHRPQEPGEHYRLIVEATQEKVRQNPNVREALLATGDLVLKPDHHQEADAPAAWKYFDILMAIRSKLRTSDRQN
jgi:endonuclease/exonuclease/phosphatase family metal-dependent hydrolase/predicted NAD-dependent protein-ADP-ribosyltransferase YbiA (DUF1768 family)